MTHLLMAQAPDAVAHELEQFWAVAAVGWSHQTIRPVVESLDPWARSPAVSYRSAMPITATMQDKVAELTPLIRARATSAEANRRMAPEVMAALVDTGLFRMWIPRALGGLEMDPTRRLR